MRKIKAEGIREIVIGTKVYRPKDGYIEVEDAEYVQHRYIFDHLPKPKPKTEPPITVKKEAK